MTLLLDCDEVLSPDRSKRSEKCSTGRVSEMIEYSFEPMIWEAQSQVRCFARIEGVDFHGWGYYARGDWRGFGHAVRAAEEMLVGELVRRHPSLIVRLLCRGEP